MVGGLDNGPYFAGALFRHTFPENDQDYFRIAGLNDLRTESNYEADRTYLPSKAVNYYPAAYDAYYNFGANAPVAEDLITQNVEMQLYEGLVVIGIPHGSHGKYNSILRVTLSNTTEVAGTRYQYLWGWAHGFQPGGPGANGFANLNVESQEDWDALDLDNAGDKTLQAAWPWVDWGLNVAAVPAAGQYVVRAWGLEEPQTWTAADGTVVDGSGNLYPTPIYLFGSGEENERGRIRALFSSQTWYQEGRTDSMQIWQIVRTEGAPDGHPPYFTFLNQNGNLIDVTELPADSMLQFVQWPGYLNPLFEFFTNMGSFDDIIRNNIMDYNGLGTRVVKVNCETREPVIVGPISPFGTFDAKSPIQPRTAFLPPRLSTFNLDFKFDQGQKTMSEDWVLEPITEAISLHCEYLTAPGEFPEQNLLTCPLVTQVLSRTNVNASDRFRFTLLNGPPSWIYVRHGAQNTDEFRFTLESGGQKSTTLGNIDRFDQFKLIARAAHPQSTYDYDAWIKDGRPVLLKLEEIGLFGQILQWEDRQELTLEALTPATDIAVYAVYSHFICRDEHSYCNFSFV